MDRGILLPQFGEVGNQGIMKEEGTKKVYDKRR